MDLYRSDFDVMHFLSPKISESLSVRDIYEMKGGERTYIYRILDRLLAKGLVKTHLLGRSYRFYLSPMGEEAYLSKKF